MMIPGSFYSDGRMSKRCGLTREALEDVCDAIYEGQAPLYMKHAWANDYKRGWADEAIQGGA